MKDIAALRNDQNRYHAMFGFFPSSTRFLKGQQHHMMEILQQFLIYSFFSWYIIICKERREFVRLSAGRLDIYGPKLTSGLIKVV